MRALARCAIAIIDDKAAGTFALAFAAAGRLTTTGPGFGTMHPSIAGKLRLAVPGHPRVNLRALCRTSNPKAPVIPVPLLRPDELLRLADSVRYDALR
ncbi:hypothetical protein T492DRAFT_907422 [Pavlovales sp. CCMP2436]|nr:hypothetical protein T492DRAFT_907422 [Pavlovales sp. CCMP2436]